MLTPAAFPANLFTAVKFDLTRYMAGNRLNGGNSQVREMAEPRWTGSFTTGLMSDARLADWRAFWDSLRGGLRGFTAFDAAQALPLKYRSGFIGLMRAGGGSFDGSATVTSLPSGDQFSMALGTLPAGFLLSRGDLVELRQGDKRGLYRLMAAATASGSGAVSLSVEPRIIPELFTTAAVAHFDYPSCIMVPDPSSWAFTSTVRKNATVSFSGVQAVY